MTGRTGTEPPKTRMGREKYSLPKPHIPFCASGIRRARSADSQKWMRGPGRIPSPRPFSVAAVGAGLPHFLDGFHIHVLPADRVAHHLAPFDAPLAQRHLAGHPGFL